MNTLSLLILKLRSIFNHPQNPLIIQTARELFRCLTWKVYSNSNTKHFHYLGYSQFGKKKIQQSNSCFYRLNTSRRYGALDSDSAIGKQLPYVFTDYKKRKWCDLGNRMALQRQIYRTSII